MQSKEIIKKIELTKQKLVLCKYIIDNFKGGGKKAEKYTQELKKSPQILLTIKIIIRRYYE